MAEMEENPKYSHLNRARRIYADALQLARSGQFEEAIDRFNEVIALDPNHVGARCNLGALYRQLGRTDDAIDCLLQALEVNSGHARTHSNIGAAFFDKGMTSDAEMAFAKAIELDPTLSEAHYNLALLYLGQKEYDRAWNHAKNAVDLGMNQAIPLLEDIETTLDK